MFRRARSIVSSTFRLRHNGQLTGSTATEAGCAWQPTIERAFDRGAIEPRPLHIAGLAEVGWLVGFVAQIGMASRSVGSDRRHRAAANPIGHWHIHPGNRTSITRIVLRTSFVRLDRHEIWHRSSYRRTSVARAACGETRGPARAPCLGNRRPDSRAGCAVGVQRREDQRDVRSAARPAWRQAGQHGRVAGLQRSGARRSGVQPLWRRAQADRCDDAGLRRHPRRPAGSGLSHLYVHNDAALRARSGIAASQDGLGAGPAQSRGPAGRRADRCALAGKALSAQGRCRCVTASRSANWACGSSRRSSSTWIIGSSRCTVGSPMRHRGSAGRWASARGSIPAPTRRTCGWPAPMREP